MFDRSKNKPTDTSSNAPEASQDASTSYTPAPTTTRNVAMIGPSIQIKGEVTGDENLVIQGKVEGSIDLGTCEVSVGESGKVSADIKAKIIKVDGEVAGDITGNEKVIISQSGNVRGNIVAPRVTLEDGAVFKGSIDMDPGDTAAKPVSLVSQKSTANDSDDSSDLLKSS